MAVVAGCGPGDVIEASLVANSTTVSAAAATTESAWQTTAPVTASVLPTPVEIPERQAPQFGSAPPAPPVPPTQQPTVDATPTVAAAATATATAEATGLAATVTPARPTPTPMPTVVAANTVPTATAQPVDEGSQEVLATNGAEVYTLTCARCHGESGFGTAEHVGLLGAGSNYTTNEMIDELTNGHPFTFGFASKLSADEIASVAAFVKVSFP